MISDNLIEDIQKFLCESIKDNQKIMAQKLSSDNPRIGISAIDNALQIEKAKKLLKELTIASGNLNYLTN